MVYIRLYFFHSHTSQSPVYAYLNPGAYISSWEEGRGLCGSQQHNANSAACDRLQIAAPGAGMQQFAALWKMFPALTLDFVLHEPAGY